ncbi:MAG: adenylyl-sulfate kinase, partial [Gammaproteobacteria bacterium]|nr:adenylyl-sulfate kinase [Gammaproteobacteria bacterium]
MVEKLLRQTDSSSRRIEIPAGALPAPCGGSLVQAFASIMEREAWCDELDSLPVLPLSADDAVDLEMLASGALSPLDGFMTHDAYRSVLEHTRLPDGHPWGLPVTLAVTPEMLRELKVGSVVALRRDSEIIGLLQVDDLYPWEPASEEIALGASLDMPRHALRRARGVSHLVGGAILLFAARDARYMLRHHLWPREIRARCTRHGWRDIAVPHLSHLWRRSHEYLVRCALESSEALLLHAPIGLEAAAHAIPPDVLTLASRHLTERYLPSDRLIENSVPSSYLGPQARAVLMHAIFSQNCGAHQIYLPDLGTEEARTRELLVEAARHGLSLRPVYMAAVYHCEACNGMVTRKSCFHGPTEFSFITDAEAEERLCLGEALPPDVARPDVARLLARGMARHLGEVPNRSGGSNLYPHVSEVSRELRQTLVGHKACALWMTGLSGSGKSTIAHRLERDLLLAGHRVFVLDGDTLRTGLNRDLGFSDTDRRENLRRAAETVKVMMEAGMIVIASFISPFRAERQMVREILGKDFHEVYVEASLDACEARDPKGLYKRARAGQIPRFTGISSPYEPPENPDVR